MRLHIACRYLLVFKADKLQIGEPHIPALTAVCKREAVPAGARGGWCLTGTDDGGLALDTIACALLKGRQRRLGGRGRR